MTATGTMAVGGTERIAGAMPNVPTMTATGRAEHTADATAMAVDGVDRVMVVGVVL